MIENFLPNPQIASSGVNADEGQAGQIINCVIPNWYPQEIIKWISHKTLNENGRADFLFYETLGGDGDATSPTFNFKSFEKLLTADTTTRIKIEAAPAVSKKGSEGKAVTLSLIHI